MMVKLQVNCKDKSVDAPLTRKCHVFLMLMILSYVSLTIIVICNNYYCKNTGVFLCHMSQCNAMCTNASCDFKGMFPLIIIYYNYKNIFIIKVDISGSVYFLYKVLL